MRGLALPKPCSVPGSASVWPAVIAMLLGEVLDGLGHSICASVATADDAVAAARRFEHKRVRVHELADAVVAGDGGPGTLITITGKGFGTNPGGGTLSGTTTVAAVGGTATFAKSGSSLPA